MGEACGAGLVLGTPHALMGSLVLTGSVSHLFFCLSASLCLCLYRSVPLLHDAALLGPSSVFGEEVYENSPELCGRNEASGETSVKLEVTFSGHTS